MSKKKKLNLKLFENTATLIKVVHLEKRKQGQRGPFHTELLCLCVFLAGGRVEVP